MTGAIIMGERGN